MNLMYKLFFLSFILLAGCGGCGRNERLEKAEPFFQKGLSLEREGQYSSAAELYQSAITEYPEYRDAYFQMGNLYEKLGLAEKARAQYKKVIELDPGYAQVYNNLGNVSGQLGELDAAIDAYTNAIRLDKSLASAHYNLGQAYVLKRDFTKAETELLTATELVPYESKYALALGMLYATQQKKNDAIFYLEKSVQADGQNAPAHYQLAMAYKSIGKYDEAILSLEKYQALTTDLQEKNIIRIKLQDIQMLKARKKLANSKKRGAFIP